MNGDIYLNLTIRSLSRMNIYKKNLYIYREDLQKITLINNLNLSEGKHDSTNKTSSNVEDNAIKIYELNKLINSLENRINTIESNLNKLDPTDKQILIYKCVEGLNLKKTAKACQYSVIQTSRRLKKALNELTALMYDLKEAP